MPPVTPSPHRFLTGGLRQRSPEKKQPAPQASSTPALQQAVVNQSTQSLSSGQVDISKADQFAPTPRFSNKRPIAQTSPQRSPSPPKAVVLNVLRSTPRLRDEVEEPLDAGPYTDDIDLSAHEQTQAMPSERSTINHQPDWASPLPYSPKRRRVDGDTLGNIGMATMRPPTTKDTYLKPTPRFTHVPAPSVDASNDPSSLLRSHASFLRTTSAILEPHAPLPDAFSPHRRGNKFVQSGMASTLQQWVVETGQVAMQSRRDRESMPADGCVLKVKVEKVRGDIPLLVDALTPEDDAIKLLLVSSRGGTELWPGSVVGTRAPNWDIMLWGQRWSVAVDWKALQ